MSRALRVGLGVLGAALALRLLAAMPAQWPGVDETVVERAARQAGRARDGAPASPRGDLPLFLFLLAGASGGFAAGYHFRLLFPPSDDAPR